MRDGRCTKCKATTVRAARNGVDLGHAKAGLRPNLDPGFRGAIRVHQTDLWNFVCLTCGYFEWGMFDPDALAYINQNWSEVPPVTTPGV